MAISAEKDESLEAKRRELASNILGKRQHDSVSARLEQGDSKSALKEIADLKARISKHEKPLPKGYYNRIQNHYDGNAMLRFDGLKHSWNVLPLVCILPKELRENYVSCQYHQWESNRSGFIEFDSHNNAKNFLDRFNGLTIPELEIPYRLSWAPFSRFNHGMAEDVDELEGDRAIKVEEYLAIEPIIEKFLDDQSRIHEEGLWSLPEVKHEEVFPWRDDGLTCILYLDNVDPNITDDDMKCIFRSYGEFSVILPREKGCGYVEFHNRDVALAAYEDLHAAFANENICDLRWGIRYPRIEAGM